MDTKNEMPTPDEFSEMNNVHINVVGASNTGKSTIMILINGALHENGFRYVVFNNENIAARPSYRMAIEAISEKTKITINEVSTDKELTYGGASNVEDFIDRWKYQSMQGFGRAQMDCSEELRKDLNSILEYVSQDHIGNGYIIECMGKIVDKITFSKLEDAREYVFDSDVFDSDESVREISDEPNVFISNRTGRSSKILKLSDYLIKF